MWLDELNNSLTTYIVMEENGKVIGYAGYWLVAGEAQITRVAVAAGIFAGKGIKNDRFI